MSGQDELEVWTHAGVEESQSWLEPEKPWSSNSGLTGSLGLEINPHAV